MCCAKILKIVNVRPGRGRKRRLLMANTFHVALYVQSIPDAVEQYRKVLGIEPAKVKHDYAKFEIQDPPVILSLSAGGEPGKLSHLGIRYSSPGEVVTEMARVKETDVPLFKQEGTTCCYAKADKFWVRDQDGVPWEMYTLLEDVEAETAADSQLRNFLGQEGKLADGRQAATAEISTPESACGVSCCVPSESQTA
jgi:catechol 2,3-dioxygenase-like lactoylglutathione lyase family enzyme